MEARAVSHPTVDVLRALGAGKLDDAAVEPVLAHLDTCADCQAQLTALSDDGFLAHLRAAHGRSTGVPAAKLPRVPTKVEIAASDILPELRNHPQYEVLRELGRGGMGVVYLARNKLMDREEVLKVVNQQLLGQHGAAERFLREIRSAAKLNHPNIVTAYTTLQAGDLLIFAMEYIVGDDLAKVVKAQGPLPVPNACFYIHQAALGLQHASEKGMIHRDIKPGNLMLAREGKKHIVKILDFGLAKATRERGTEHDLTGDNKMLGTPDYIAPEQALDATHADIRADIYSLGCSLYYLLTGRAPFKAKSLFELLQAHMSTTATPVHELRPDVPTALSAVVAKMMAKEPAQRYQTPADVAKALAPFVKGSAEALPAERAASGLDPWATVTATPDAKIGSGVETVSPGRRQETMVEKPAPLVQLSPDMARLGPSGTLGGRKLLIGAGIGVGVLLMLVLGTALVVGGVLMLRTKDGTIVLDRLPADAIVIEGESIILKQKEEGKDIEISVVPGKHKLQIKHPDFKIQTEEFTLAVRDKHSIHVKLERPEKAPNKAGRDEGGPPLAADALIREMLFVPVPKGTFWMGWASGKKESKQVTITEDFELAAYTVTQEQWQTVMKENPSYFSRQGKGSDKVAEVSDADLKRFPVESVSWDDVQKFLQKLNAGQTGRGWRYRLPKEAEWEYACRNAVQTKEECSFHFYFAKGTNDLSSNEANFVGNKPAGNGAKGKSLGRTTTVGSYGGNKLGLYDMHGNVWQLCDDLWDAAGSDRVIRGGSWNCIGLLCRAEIRGRNAPSYRGDGGLGFRLARVPSGEIKELPPQQKGTFWMGGGSYLDVAAKQLKFREPTDQVTIANDFELAAYTVTQGQWEAVIGINPSNFSRKGKGSEAVKDVTDADLKRFPVESVSWEDVQKFLQSLNEREKGKGWKYRLPTEAEWEYGCRGAATDRAECSFDFYLAKPTNDLSWGEANFASEFQVGNGTKGKSLGRPTMVGKYTANKLGLHDMHGNVLQWCEDLRKTGNRGISGRQLVRLRLGRPAWPGRKRLRLPAADAQLQRGLPPCPSSVRRQGIRQWPSATSQASQRSPLARSSRVPRRRTDCCTTCAA